jgi:biotin synthase
MMGRWGLEGMASFEQANVARKEGDKLEKRPRSRPSESVELPAASL